MMKLARNCLILLPLLMAGCASSPPPKVAAPPTYAESVANRSQPQSEADRASECSWLNFEMHRQQGGLSLAATLEPGSQKRKEVLQAVHINMLALQTREQKIGCVSQGGVMPLLSPSP